MASAQEGAVDDIRLIMPSHPPCTHTTTDGICTGCQKLGVLEAQFHDVYNQLREIQAQHCTLLEDRNEAHDILSRLPVEVGWKILKDCCAPEPHGAHPIMRHSESQNRAIASVCKAWRAIALAAPFLWTSLSLDVHRVNPSHRTQLERRFDLSGRAPLSISIYTSNSRAHRDQEDEEPGEPEVDPGARLLAQLVTSRLEKIRILVIEAPCDLLKAFRSVHVPERQALTLDELHIHQIDSVHPLFRQDLFPIDFGSDVTVRKACIGHFPPSGIQVQWDQLEELKLENVTISSGLWVLARASRVSILDIEFGGEDSLVDHPSVLPLVMPSVRTLTTREIMAMERMFALTLMPRLTTLDMRQMTGDDLRSFRPTIQNFLSHCSSTLAAFSIELLGKFASHFLIPILETIPNVTDLTIRHGEGNRQSLTSILERLALVAESEEHIFNRPLLTKLERLFIVTDRPISWGTLIDFMVSRRPPLASVVQEDVQIAQTKQPSFLQSIEVEFLNHIPPTLDLVDIVRLQQLRQLGCSILLRLRVEIPEGQEGEIPSGPLTVDFLELCKRHHRIV